jgi:TPR repeat protein
MKSIWIYATPIACGLVIAGAAIGWHLHSQAGFERKLQEDAQDCRARADRGDAKSEYDLGAMYSGGRGVPQNYSESLRWDRKAADQGYPTADYAVGFSYYHGLGVPQDYGEALRWYRIAAEKGNAEAQYAVGYMDHHGQAVQQNDPEALGWYRRAAEQGDLPAQYEVGYFHEKGLSVPQDYSEALRWYRKAADRGYAKAEAEIGYLTFYGYGNPPDHLEANRWFRKAAHQGEPYAMRAISYRLTPLRIFFLVIQLLAGLYLTFNFLSFNLWEPNEGLRETRRKVMTGTGVLFLLSAGVDWYGYTHYLIRPLIYGFNTFTFVKWLLDGILAGLFLYFYLKLKKRQEKLAQG